jgi:hypothetical protein
MLTAQNIHGTYTMAYDALDQMRAAQELFEQVLTMSYDSELTSTATQADSFGAKPLRLSRPSRPCSTSARAPDGTRPNEGCVTLSMVRIWLDYSSQPTAHSRAVGDSVPGLFFHPPHHSAYA